MKLVHEIESTGSLPDKWGEKVVSVMFADDDKDWKARVSVADHYKAIGMTKLYLSRDVDRPWEYVTKCEPGGSHRIDIATDVRFTANHPCGLEFTWCFDIEPRSANGSGSYDIDVDAIQCVMAKLPRGARQQFADYLLSCAVSVEKNAAEYQATAQKQYGQAASLREAAKSNARVLGRDPVQPISSDES